MKRFIRFSGGVESTTMCLLYGKGATAIWCDTGAEHGEMYERINKVEDYLKKNYSYIIYNLSEPFVPREEPCQKSVGSVSATPARSGWRFTNSKPRRRARETVWRVPPGEPSYQATSSEAWSTR